MDALWNTVDELTPNACLSLLARHSFGRVGLSVDALPVVLPVNYVLDGERCVFRDFATGDHDAAVFGPVDAGAEGPADASPCDASTAADAASQADAAPCSAADASAESDPGE